MQTANAAIGDEAAEYAVQCVVTGGAGAAAYAALSQFVEDVRRLGGKTVTMSFWAKAASGAPKSGQTARTRPPALADHRRQVSRSALRR